MEKISTISEWERVLEESKAAPVVVYKHSDSCGTCKASARELFEAVQHKEITNKVYFLVIQEARDLSQRIEEDLALPHQTPQAIVVLNERACYAVGGDEDIGAADIAARIELIAEAHRGIFSDDELE